MTRSPVEPSGWGQCPSEGDPVELLPPPPTLAGGPVSRGQEWASGSHTRVPRPAASSLRGGGRAPGLCSRLPRCRQRSECTGWVLPATCPREWSRHAGPWTAYLCTQPPTEAPPRRPGARAEPGLPSRVCLLVPKSSSFHGSVLQASSRTHSPVSVPASSPQPCSPKAGCDLTASGASSSDPSPLGRTA